MVKQPFGPIYHHKQKYRSMKIRILLPLMLITVLLSSCDTEDSELINSYNSGLLHQIKYGSELCYEYIYNESDQIVEEKSKYHYTKHNYQNGRLISSDHYVDAGMFSSSSYIADSAINRKEWVNPENTEKNSTKFYSYDNKGNLIKSENNLDICEFSYDENGRMTRQTFYHENERTGYFDYTYDENDNLSKKLHYWILNSGVTELQTTTVYEYDSKINPYKAFSTLKIPGEYTNANNIIKETYTINHEVDKYIDKVQITENTYRYNSRGLPVSKNKTETFIYY